MSIREERRGYLLDLQRKKLKGAREVPRRTWKSQLRERYRSGKPAPLPLAPATLTKVIKSNNHLMERRLCLEKIGMLTGMLPRLDQLHEERKHCQSKKEANLKRTCKQVRIQNLTRIRKMARWR